MLIDLMFVGNKYGNKNNFVLQVSVCQNYFNYGLKIIQNCFSFSFLCFDIQFVRFVLF